MKLTQKEAAARLGVTVKTFQRYRNRYAWLTPRGFTGLVPMFNEKDLVRLEKQVMKDRLAYVAAMKALWGRPQKKRDAGVVSMDELRSERGAS